MVELSNKIKKHGQAKLASAIGVNPQAIWNWINRQKQVPSEYVLAVEKETGIPCWEIRPDLYPKKRFGKKSA